MRHLFIGIMIISSVGAAASRCPDDYKYNFKKCTESIHILGKKPVVKVTYPSENTPLNISWSSEEGKLKKIFQ